jgi:hypothetical protein
MSVDQLPPGNARAPQRQAQLVRYDEYIDKQIEATRRTVKVVDIMTALLTMVIGTLGFLLTAAAAEHWLVPDGFNLAERMVLFVILFGALAFYTTRKLWPLVVGSINPAYAAQAIEHDNPSLKNSLLNLLLFRERRDDVTDAVYETLEEQAARRLTRVHVDSAVDRTHLLRLGYVLVGVIAALALYKILSPKDPFVSAERLLMPWARIAPASRVVIENVEPGVVTLARGDVLTVSADVRGIGEDDPVVIRYTTADGQALDRPATMKPSAAGLRFTGQIPPAEDGAKAGVAQNLRYRIEAGDARSLDYAVTVVAAPTITVERIDYDYPDYTGFADRSIDRLGDIRAIEGTRVTIHARANEPIQEADIDFEADGRRDLRLKHTLSEAEATFTLELRDDRQTPKFTSYVLRFTGAGGRPNRDPVKFPIDVAPDLGPEVHILAPAEKTRDVRVDETVAIEIDAIDPDFALAEVRLSGEAAGNRVLDEKLLQQEHTGRFTNRFLFTPHEHSLKPGDVVRYWVTARDSRAPQANEATSDSQTLRIVGTNPNQPGQRPQDRVAQRDQDAQRDQRQPQEGGDSQEGESASADGQSGGDSGGSSSSASEGREQGKPNGDPQPGESQGESASADGSSDQPSEQDSSNQPGEGNGSDSNSQNQSGDQESENQGQSSTSENGNESDNSNPQPGGTNSGKSDKPSSASDQNQDSNQQGESGSNAGEQDQTADGNPSQPGTNSKPGTSQPNNNNNNQSQPGGDSNPVSSEGDNDADAFKRIQDFLKQQGKLPKDQQGESEDKSPNESQSESEGESASADGNQPENSNEGSPSSNEGDSNPDQNQPGEPASAGGTKPQPDKSSDPSEQGSDQSKPDQSKPGEPSNDSSPNPNANQDQPSDSTDGQPTSSEGESGAGNQPKESQGAPESDQQAKPDDQDKWQQKPSGDKQGDQQDPASGGQGKKKNDSQGNEGGDRTGGGDQGAGQKSERDGTGSDGQNQSSDEGVGQSSERGAGDKSSDAGTSPESSAKSDKPTGQPGSGEKGNGSSQREGTGVQPGDAQNQSGATPPGEPEGESAPGSNEQDHSADGNQPESFNEGSPSSNSDASNSDASNQDANKQNPPQQSPQPSGSQQPSASDKNQNDPNAKQPNGDQPNGDQPSADRPNSDQPQPGSQDSPPGSQDSKSGSNPDGAGRVPNGKIEPSASTGDAPAADAANLEYARKQTDLVLETLADQMKRKKVDPRLLDKLGWTEADLKRFLDRWQQLKAAADANSPDSAADEAQRELDDALRSLGLRRGQLGESKVSDDTNRNLRQGYRGAVPLEYQERLRAYNQGVSRARQTEE